MPAPPVLLRKFLSHARNRLHEFTREVPIVTRTGEVRLCSIKLSEVVSGPARFFVGLLFDLTEVTELMEKNKQVGPALRLTDGHSYSGSGRQPAEHGWALVHAWLSDSAVWLSGAGGVWWWWWSIIRCSRRRPPPCSCSTTPAASCRSTGGE